MRSRALGAWLVVAIATAAAALLAASNALPAGPRVLGAAPLVLVLPGAALVLAAFPRTMPGWGERIALAFGLSLAVSAAGGLVFWIIDTRAGLLPWLCWLVGVAAAGLTVALVRMMRSRTREAPAAAPHASRRLLGVADVLLLALAAVMTVGAVAYARSAANGYTQPTAVQLWMVPLPASDPLTLDIGVGNKAPTSASYRLEIVQEGAETLRYDVPLTGGQTWELTYTPDAAVSTAVIVTSLYEHDGTTPIRQVRYWPSSQSPG